MLYPGTVLRLDAVNGMYQLLERVFGYRLDLGAKGRRIPIDDAAAPCVGLCLENLLALVHTEVARIRA
jgi:hypothetical protein